MTVEIGDVVRAVAQISMPDEVDAVNVWDFLRYDTEGTDPTNGQVSTAMAQALIDIYGEIQPDLSDLVTVVSTKNYQLGWDGGTWVVERLLGEEAVGVQGGSAGEMLPHGVAGLINLVTPFSRRYGRKYIPGLNEGAIVDGIFSANPVLDLVAMAAEYLADHVFQSVYLLKATTLGNDGAHRLFTGYGASGTPAYQRRRKPGVGS